MEFKTSLNGIGAVNRRLALKEIPCVVNEIFSFHGQKREAREQIANCTRDLQLHSFVILNWGDPKSKRGKAPFVLILNDEEDIKYFALVLLYCPIVPVLLFLQLQLITLKKLQVLKPIAQ
uniref:Uncharacterized protein n=1 Tax=Glossina austeni TaxID=7395 RepID=A0A1A9VRJ9_GLOAU